MQGFGDYDIIDLSVPLQHNAVSEPFPAKIRYVNHKKGGLQMRWFMGVKGKDLEYSDGEGWALEKVSAITHTGTHVDAPYHYGAMSGGKPARTIDEVPLQWCFAPGIRLDMRHLEHGAEITVDELKSSLASIEYELQGGEIILLQTDADKRIDSKAYFNNQAWAERAPYGSSTKDPRHWD